MNPARNWLVVREVISSTENGASVMSALPDLVRRLVDEKAWQDFTAPNPIGPVHHDTFSEFIRDHPPRGLDSRVDQMLALCGTDRDLIAEVRRLAYGDIPPAGTHGDGPGRGHTDKRDEPLNSFIPNSAEYLVARLKRDDPVLAEKVVNGEVSPYRAQQEKGWRPPRIYVTSAERTAASLRKHMKPETRRALARLLLDEEVNDGRESQA